MDEALSILIFHAIGKEEPRSVIGRRTLPVAGYAFIQFTFVVVTAVAVVVVVVVVFSRMIRWIEIKYEPYPRISLCNFLLILARAPFEWNSFITHCYKPSYWLS